MGTVFMLAGQFSISRKCPISSLGKVWCQDLMRIDQKIGQGHSPFDVRNLLFAREYGKRARTPLVDFVNIPLNDE